MKEIKQIPKSIIYQIPLVLPFVARAQDFSLTQAGMNFKGIVDYVISLIELLVPILSAGAFVVFFWGLSKFILNSGSPAEVTKGKNYMFWGVLALFVLVSARAIISIIASNLEIGDTGNIPQL